MNREKIRNIVLVVGIIAVLIWGCCNWIGNWIANSSEISSAWEKAQEEVKKEQEHTEEKNIDRITNNAKTPRYKELKKNADKFKGVNAIYTGKVVEAAEKSGVSIFRIEVTNKHGNIWDDVIFVTYGSESNIVEDDIVKVYGTLKGNYTYKSQAGWNITVPEMDAEAIQIVKKSN